MPRHPTGEDDGTMTWTPASTGSETSFVRATTSRRGLMLGGIGLSVAAVSGCGGGESPTGGTSAAPASSASGGASGTGRTLAKKSEIPVGGGKVVQSTKVVVTQPTAGTFAAVSAVCTHEGCLVSDPSGGTIKCRCHGSEFALDGTVKKGPAKKPLDKVNVQSGGDSVSLA